MIVTCEGCRTKYLLGDEKVPEKGIRVRCPKCNSVWRLFPPPPESVFEVSSNRFAADAPKVETANEGWASTEQRTSGAERAYEAESFDESCEATDDGGSQEPREKELDPEVRKKRERARRLARVFVSDILVYNRKKRDRGLASGDLITALGPEIKKAWEAYKEKIGPELVESTNYFRESLNEILAEGQKIF